MIEVETRKIDAKEREIINNKSSSSIHTIVAGHLKLPMTEALLKGSVLKVLLQIKKYPPSRRPRPTLPRFRPENSERGGTEEGNAQQHVTQAAAQR
jgi:hypothetical protein